MQLGEKKNDISPNGGRGGAASLRRDSIMKQFELMATLDTQSALLSIQRAENYYSKFTHILRLTPTKKIGFKLETSRAIYDFILFSENTSGANDRNFAKKINSWLRVLQY